jgi:hypothetical protein
MGIVQTNKDFNKNLIKSEIKELRKSLNLRQTAEVLNAKGLRTMTNKLWNACNVDSFIKYNIGFNDEVDEGLLSIILYGRENRLKTSQIIKIIKKHLNKEYSLRDINYIIENNQDSIDSVKVYPEFQEVYNDIYYLS